MKANSFFGVSALLAALAGAATLAACNFEVGGEDPTGPSGGSGHPAPTMTSCGKLNVTLSSGPRNVWAWPEGDTYGVNSFYIWEVDWNGSPDNPEFYWKHDGNPVESALPFNNWQIPATLWSAARFNLDGYDPYHFSVEDLFALGYVPTAGSPGVGSWTAKTGAKNDGTCPGTDYMIGGWSRCIGKWQQDPAAPKTIEAGKAYLIMMGMIVPLGTDSAGHKLNRVQSCYLNAFIAKGWGPQGK